MKEDKFLSAVRCGVGCVGGGGAEHATQEDARRFRHVRGADRLTESCRTVRYTSRDLYFFADVAQ